MRSSFRTGLYTSILEPDSSTGLFELVLRREQQAQSQYGRNLVVTLGDSRFAYYPRVANQQTAATGFVFRNAGIAGTDPRAWYYMLRDLDPTRERYRAIVLGVVDYDDEDGAYEVGDDLRHPALRGRPVAPQRCHPVSLSPSRIPPRGGMRSAAACSKASCSSAISWRCSRIPRSASPT